EVSGRFGQDGLDHCAATLQFACQVGGLECRHAAGHAEQDSFAFELHAGCIAHRARKLLPVAVLQFVLVIAPRPVAGTLSAQQRDQLREAPCRLCRRKGASSSGAKYIGICAMPTYSAKASPAVPAVTTSIRPMLRLPLRIVAS